MESPVEIFQLQHPKLKKFLELPNFEIHRTVGDNQICAIYFSSHDIYYPNTEKAFSYSISERNRYEWKKNLYPDATLHIFLRDLKKQWYLEGINNEIDSIDNLYNFLKKETKGFQIITIGSSAGGFAAILLGSMLKARKVYAFNPQFNLHIVAKKSNPIIDPLLFKYQNMGSFQEYFDLNNFISTEVPVFYFHSAYSSIDIEQKNSLRKDSPIKILKFKTSNHGFPFLRSNIPYVFLLSSEILNQYSSKYNHPIFFSIKANGLFNTCKELSAAILKRIEKKFMERLNRMK